MHAILFLTRQCTLKCAYCYVEKHEHSHMPIEVALKAADLVLEKSVEEKKARISFFGGEPFIRFDVMREVTDYAEKKAKKLGVALKLHVATNGTLITPEIIDWIAKKKLTVEFSLDGVPAAQDANRPFNDGRGSYAAVVKHLPTLYKKAKHLVAVAVVSPATAQKLYDSTLHVMDDLGIRNFVPVVDYTAQWDEAGLYTLKEQYEKLAEWYLERSRTRKKDLFYYSLFDAHIAAHIKGGFRPGDFCDVGRNIFAVAEDGRIFPCVRFAGKPERAAGFVMGHVDTGFIMKKCHEIAAENLKPRTTCQGCSLDGRCFTYCPCLNWDTTGEFTTVPGILCANESMLIPIADRLARELIAEENPSFMRKHYKKEIEPIDIV